MKVSEDLHPLLTENPQIKHWQIWQQPVFTNTPPHPPPRSLQPKPLQHHWTRSDEAQLSEEFLAHRRTSTFQKKEAKWKTVPFNSKNSSKHDFECHALQKQQRREAVDILNSAYMQISTTSLWNIINKPTQTIREETPYHPAAAALRSSMNRRYLERKITCSFCHKKKKKINL